MRHLKPRYTDNWLGSFKAAKTLAASIEGFWRDRGYHGIETSVERADGFAETYQIRSNMVNGLPPLIRAAQAA